MHKIESSNRNVWAFFVLEKFLMERKLFTNSKMSASDGIIFKKLIEDKWLTCCIKLQSASDRLQK